ncbi:MAG: formate C-acetyltransferase/glycerol dehydratase family glycyl radical enzyme, partial [Bacteroidia bacterium]|nr:formate C-acetyltransferase/glycerol dehydratase family glycyl radical enzyme [Bacteroidia bacterium]
MILNFQNLRPSDRILSLRKKTLSSVRYLSIEQAKIITRVYQENENLPVILKRSKSLAQSLSEMTIAIDPGELIVGNRTPGIRAGVVFPESGLAWLVNEIETLPDRLQDPFNVRQEDISYFKEYIEPFWRGKTLEDDIYKSFGEEIKAIESIVKINQKDHAQGHICPKVEDWLRYGPSGLLKIARSKMKKASGYQKVFYESVCITLEASCKFIHRYEVLATALAKNHNEKIKRKELKEVATICGNLSENPPSTFREALQSVWFLFVILQMESNASSFSPGRLDQYLYPFFIKDLKSGRIYINNAIELVDALFIKFNQIVYMRNSQSAKY